MFKHSFKPYIENAPYGIFVFNSNGECIEVNSNACRMTGYTENELIGMKLIKLIVDEDKNIALASFNSVEQTNINKLQINCKTKSGLEKVWSISSIKVAENRFLGFAEDITESINLKAQLNREEALLRKYLDTANIMFIVIARDECVESINKKGCETLGLKEKDILGKNWFDNFIPENMRVEVKQVFNRDLNSETEDVTFFENSIINANGDERIISWHNTVLRDQSGNVDSVLCAGNDITERKRAVQKLIESQAFLQAAFDNSPAGIAIADAPEGNLLYVNNGGLSIRGKSKEEIVDNIDYKKYVSSWNLFRLDGTPYKDEEVPLARTVLYGEVCSEELIVRRDNQEDRYVLINTAPIKDKDNNIIAGIAVLLDITEKRESEAKHKHSEMQLNRAEHIANIGSWERDLATETFICSDNFSNIIGFDSLNTHPTFIDLLNAIHKDDKDYVLGEIKETLKHRTKNQIEFRLMMTDGKIKYVRMSGSIIRDAEGKATKIIAAIMDISKIKIQELENKKLEDRLRNQQKLESIGTLASGVAHEINNPLNGILNYGQLILDAKLGNDEIDEYASEIINGTNRVATIVANLLSFSRQNHYGHSYAHIDDIISNALSLMNVQFTHDHIKLHLKVDKNIPRLKCRSQQIEKVIMNLLTNSSDALNEAYPNYDENKVINLYCSEFVYEGRRGVKLIVEDFGVGISDEVKDKIFDPFFTTKGRAKVTGLGLAISHGIVMDHHGEITVESEENKFTRFIVTLPCDLELVADSS